MKLLNMKDKIIIWINKNLLYFGLAKFLKENYDCHLNAIIDVTDRPKKFFQQQKLVHFEKVWYYHDYINPKIKSDLEYLKSFEEKYKIDLWLLAYNERIFYEFNKYYKFRTDEVLSILEQECRLFESILDEIKPDFLVMDLFTLHHSYLFYKICKARGVKILLLKIGLIGNKCFITNEEEAVCYKGNNSSGRNSRTFEELQNYLNEFSVYDLGMEYTHRFLGSKLALFKAALQFLLLSDNSNIRTNYTYYGRTKLKVLIKSMLYSLKTRYRKNFIDRNLIHKIDNGEPFIFFPLHIEEEHSLLILAPFYTNELEVIKHVVKSLPIGYKLYVKEHPLMSTRGWRSISTYKKIMNLPNVKLVHPSIKPEEIIKKSSLVISISGTASFEAGFYKKPSIIFVDTAFSMLPYVHRLTSVEQLPEVIRTTLKKEVNASDINEYINYIDSISFKLNYNALAQDMQDYFHYGGFLVDVDISTQKMTSFLEKHRSEFELLALEHIKKIKLEM